MPDRVLVSGPVRDARLLTMEPGADAFEAVVQAERARAHELGVAEGRVLERAEAANRLDAAVERVDGLCAEAEKDLTGASIDLALLIARNLLQREVSAGQHDIEKIVRQTLAEANVGRKPCVVHLNPADYAQLADVPFRSGTSIEADNEVALGDVHVETSLGLLVRETLGALDAIGRRLREELA